MRLMLISVFILVFSSFSFAVSYEGKKQSQKLSRIGKNLEGMDRFETSLSAPIFRVWEETHYVTKSIPYEELVCTSLPGKGKGNWHGFFNVPKSEKPAALSRAIKGIGSKTAPKMVKYFNHKPRTWKAFANLIESAESEVPGVYHRTVIQYGKENQKSLGYYSQTDCHYETIYKTIRVPQTIREEEFVRQANGFFEIFVEGGALLAGEAESMVVEYDGFESSISISSKYNHYRVERMENGPGVVFRLSGKRKAIVPSNHVEMSLNIKNGELILNVIDPSFDAEIGAQNRLNVEIYRDSRFWVDKKKATMTLEIESGSTSIPTGFRNFENGYKYYVKYRVQRLGTPFYNARSSVEKQSHKVQN